MPSVRQFTYPSTAATSKSHFHIITLQVCILWLNTKPNLLRTFEDVVIGFITCNTVYKLVICFTASPHRPVRHTWSGFPVYMNAIQLPLSEAITSRPTLNRLQVAIVREHQRTTVRAWTWKSTSSLSRSCILSPPAYLPAWMTCWQLEKMRGSYSYSYIYTVSPKVR